MDMEKRLSRRLKAEVTVQYKVKEMPVVMGGQMVCEPTSDITRTRNLSEKGVFLTISRIIPFEAILDIKIRIPHIKECLNLAGRVVFCKEIRKDFVYGIGAEFINLTDVQKKALRDLIKRLTKK